MTKERSGDATSECRERGENGVIGGRSGGGMEGFGLGLG